MINTWMKMCYEGIFFSIGDESVEMRSESLRSFLPKAYKYNKIPVKTIKIPTMTTYILPSLCIRSLISTSGTCCKNIRRRKYINLTPSRTKRDQAGLRLGLKIRSTRVIVKQSSSYLRLFTTLVEENN